MFNLPGSTDLSAHKRKIFNFKLLKLDLLKKAKRQNLQLALIKFVLFYLPGNIRIVSR